MIKSTICIALLSIVGSFQINFLYGQNSFELIYSTPQDEEIFSGALHSSGNVYLAGLTRSPDSWDTNPFIMMIRPNGEMETIKWLNEDTISSISQVLELDNGNLMLIGQCGLSSGIEYTKRWLRIIDPELNIIADHYYTQDTDYISVFQTNAIIDEEGNIVSIGSVEFNDIYPGYETADFYMAKYSQNGDSLAFQVFPFINHYEETYDLITIPASDQYLAITNAFFIGMPTPQIVRISNELEIISNKWFDIPYFDRPCSINHWLTNSTFLISGFTLDQSVEPEDQQIGVLKADTNATIIKYLELGKPDTIDNPAYINSMEYVNDTTIYIGGFMNFIAFWPIEPSYVELYLIDTNLNLLGYRQFGGDINYRLYGILATADGGCLLYTTTYSESNNYHEHDVHIFKVPRDSIEIITHITESPYVPAKELNAFPNPVKDVVNIPLGASRENIRINLYKSDGKKIMDILKCIKGNLITIDVRHLPSGVYIYNISSLGMAISSGKFIKL